MKHNKKYGKTSVKVRIYIGFFLGVTLLILIMFLFQLWALFEVGALFYLFFYIGAGLGATKACRIYEEQCKQEYLEKEHLKKEYLEKEIRKTKETREAVPNEWRCAKCGKINQSYVGTCGCGLTRQESLLNRTNVIENTNTQDKKGTSNPKEAVCNVCGNTIVGQYTKVKNKKTGEILYKLCADCKQKFLTATGNNSYPKNVEEIKQIINN